MLEAIKDYLQGIDGLEKLDVFVNHSPGNNETLSLINVPMDNNGVITTFMDGSTIRNYTVMVNVTKEYSTNKAFQKINYGTLQMLENVSDIINENNLNNTLPNIDGVQTIEVKDSPYISGVSEDGTIAEYSLVCNITYLKERI